MTDSNAINTTDFHECLLNDNELIVRLSIITQGNLVEQRREIRKSLVLAGLNEFEINTKITLKDISQKIEAITKCILNDADIVSILEELIKEKILEDLGNTQYKITIKKTIPDFSELTQPIWLDFQKFLIARYPSYDLHLHKELRNVFDNILLRILTRYVSSKPLDNQIDTIPIENIIPVLKIELGNAFSVKEVRHKFETILLEYLSGTSRILTDFIFKSYIGLINIDLVSREQEIPSIDFSEKIEFLLLDTSFIVPLLCKTDPKYMLSMSLCNQCKKMKIPIYYTDRTKLEINKLINSSKQETGNLQKGSRGASNNQFILDYLNQKEKTSWSQYIILLDAWEKTISENWNIKRIPEKIIPPTNLNCYSKIKNFIKIADEFRHHERAGRDIDYQPRKRNEYLYDHDAYCISLIYSYKKNTSKQNKDKWQWFLTYDNLLSFINYSQLKEYDDIGFVIQPKTFLNYLFAYSKIRFNDIDIEDVKIALLKYTVRQPTTELSLDDYSKLVSLKVDFGEENAEILKEVFLRSPLLDELRKALHNDHDGDADSIAFQILSKPNVSELIKQIVYSEEEKQLDKKAKARLVDELREKTRTIEIKEAQIEVLQTSNKPQLIINQSMNSSISIDVNIQQNTQYLIQQLEKLDAFQNTKIERPPAALTKENTQKWLRNVKDAIDIGKDISKEIKDLLPLITLILSNIH
ncbi:MAG: hypothetical protein CVV30_02070 [Methanomicrobiales archaeon HGW-Methanomicrobiales-1]|jgi:hypothetical protein|nr:MAG: hypothetical protein CVV30_02070 [Methanomicrobiales archaeon HGW-Methanomicrobiales-1]